MRAKSNTIHLQLQIVVQNQNTLWFQRTRRQQGVHTLFSYTAALCHLLHLHTLDSVCKCCHPRGFYHCVLFVIVLTCCRVAWFFKAATSARLNSYSVLISPHNGSFTDWGRSAKGYGFLFLLSFTLAVSKELGDTTVSSAPLEALAPVLEPSSGLSESLNGVAVLSLAWLRNRHGVGMGGNVDMGGRFRFMKTWGMKPSQLGRGKHASATSITSSGTWVAVNRVILK